MSFSPADVPEIAAGYWWDAGLGVTDPGAATFRWLEQNGKTGADQVQAISSRPTPTSIPLAGGRSALRWDRSSLDAPAGAGTRSQSASTIVAGWTGATYVCGWWRTNGTAFFASNNMFSHSTSSTARRFLAIYASATEIQLQCSANGSTINSVNFALPPFNVFFFMEALFNPAAASGSRGELWVNRVKQSITAGGITVSSLFDATSRIGVTASTATTEHGYVTDCAWCAYANGIPSDLHRDQLCGYRRAALAAHPNALVLGSHAAGAIALPSATSGISPSHAQGSITEN